MKKLNIFMSALLGLGLASCSENFDPEVGPQSNAQESVLQVGDVTVNTLLPDAISLADYIDEENGTEKPISIGVATVKEGAMPQNTVLHAEVMYSRDPSFTNFALTVAEVNDAGEITLSPSSLQETYFNVITKNPNTTTLYMRTVLGTVTGGDAAAIIGKPGENFYAERAVQFTPLNKLTIAPAYYIVGGPNSDWAGSAADRSIKFQHSGEDVYVDPVFTVTFNAADGDTWFAIADDQACDAISSGDWSQLYGIVGGDSEAKEGKIARRSELGADNSFKVPAGAKKIRVTLNMMEQTYKVEAVSIADAYYLVGGNGSWSSDKSQKFSHSDKDAFEDPVFTYVITGGSDTWFAFGDADALDAIDAGDWTQLYGTTGASEDLSGSFDRRYNLGGDHSFHVDGSAKFYRFTVNMLENTYQITPLNFDPYIYFIGATDGWANAEQKLALTDESGVYTGYLYCADPNGWGNEFKFQKTPGDWGTEINTGHMTGGITGDFGDGGGNFKATAGEGVYYVTLNMATMSINAIKVEKMGIIGDFNGWGADFEMTWNATDYCFQATGAGVTANGWKFRLNGGWDINLGGSVDNLVANGDNLSVVGNTIRLYPTRKGKDNIYCTVE
ncbi:MAG: hypothetical protein J6M01_05830 [Prevotella sp.]|nr:hypothetical protein [Prevotella sp.]